MDTRDAFHPAGEPSREPARTPHSWLWAILWRHRGMVGAVLVYAAGAGLLTLATPVAVQALVSNVAFGTLLQPLVVLAVMLFFGLGLRGGLRVMQAWVVEALQRRLFVDFTEEAATRLPHTAPHVLDRSHGPELANRFFDVYTVQKATASLLLGGLDAVLTAGVGMLVLAFYHPILLAFDVVLVLALAAWVGVLGRGGVDSAVDESKAKYALGHTLEQTLGHALSTRSAMGRATVRRLIDQDAEAYLRARARHFRVVLRQLIGAVVLQAVASAALLGVGGWLVIQRQLTLGQLVAAELIVTGVVAAFASLGKHAETYYDLLAALDKLGTLLGLEHERVDGLVADSSRGPARVTLRLADGGVGHGHVEIPAGARVRVVDYSSGASCDALLRLLFGWRTGRHQRVQLDGLNAADLSLEALRSQVAWVKDAEIWSVSVLDNLCFEAPEATLSDVRRALEMVKLDAAIEQLPQGLETPLSPGGPLNPSQALRLTLARAVLRRPRLLLLGEAFDALRPDLRQEVLASLADPQAPWTLLVCSHDERLEEHCTHRLDLSGGALRECRA